MLVISSIGACHRLKIIKICRKALRREISAGLFFFGLYNICWGMRKIGSVIFVGVCEKFKQNNTRNLLYPLNLNGLEAS
jgi:hypothetical protein